MALLQRLQHRRVQLHLTHHHHAHFRQVLVIITDCIAQRSQVRIVGGLIPARRDHSVLRRSVARLLCVSTQSHRHHLVCSQRLRQHTTHLGIEVVIEAYVSHRVREATVVATRNENVVETLEGGYLVEMAVPVEVHLRDELGQDRVVLLHLAEGEDVHDNLVLCQKRRQPTRQP